MQTLLFACDWVWLWPSGVHWQACGGLGSLADGKAHRGRTTGTISPDLELWLARAAADAIVDEVASWRRCSSAHSLARCHSSRIFSVRRPDLLIGGSAVFRRAVRTLTTARAHPVADRELRADAPSLERLFLPLPIVVGSSNDIPKFLRQHRAWAPCCSLMPWGSRLRPRASRDSRLTQIKCRKRPRTLMARTGTALRGHGWRNRASGRPNLSRASVNKNERYTAIFRAFDSWRVLDDDRARHRRFGRTAMMSTPRAPAPRRWPCAGRNGRR